MRRVIGDRRAVLAAGVIGALPVTSVAVAATTQLPKYNYKNLRGDHHRGRLVYGRAVHHRRGGALPQGRRDRCSDHSRHLRYGRRLPALLQGRDRPLGRLAADEDLRGAGVQEEQRRRVAGVPCRERRAHGRREQPEHVGDLPHCRRAQEDLGAGLEDLELERRARRVPRRAAQAVCTGNRLGDARVLHRGDQRPCQGEPDRLSRLRGRQRARPGIIGERGGLGYFGFSYYEEYRNRLRAVRIRNPKTGQCVAPSVAAVHSNAYKPLSRPLFIYAKGSSFRRTELQACLGFIFQHIAKRAAFVPLTKAQLKRARNYYLLSVRLARNS